MSPFLKILLTASALLSIPLEFVVEKEQSVFWGYNIPLMEVGYGIAGPLVLIVLVRILAFISLKKEDFYD